MKRVYKQVSVEAAAGGGWEVRLDGRPLRTPARQPLHLPTRALAEAVAAEWDAQSDEIRPRSMPLTQLANVAIDRARDQHAQMVEAVAVYAGTDLLCYRADHPPALAERQRREWQPLLDWCALRYDATLAPTVGIVHRPQSEGALAALRAAVGDLDPWRLAALQNAVGTAGSLVIGLALLEGRVTPAEAYALSQLDELFQAEQWGEDAEAAARRASIRADLEATGRFLTALAADAA